MKKRILFIMVLGIIAGLVILGGKYLYQYLMKQSQEPVSIMIASDMHYLSPEYRGEYFKEPFSGFDGKLTHYSPEYFDAFLAEAIEQQPDVLILSGDLTLNGSLKSHEDFIAKLSKVQEAGIDVLVIPGNHDVNSQSGDYSGEEPVVVSSVFSSGFSEMYENFGPAQALSRDENSFSYIYEVNPYLRIVMLDSNLERKCWVEASTLSWLEEQLKDAKADGADVIAVTHQNLHIHNEMLYFSYQLYNADELLALYEEYDVLCNFSGHIHIQSIVEDSTVPEVAVGSLAVAGTQYGKITYDGKTLAYTTEKTDVSAYAAANGYTDENLLDFNNHSIWYFEEVARLQAYEHFADSGLSQEDITLLAETYAKINSAYFMGESIDTSTLSEGLAMWETQKDNFIYKYIQTMLMETSTDNQNLTIEIN